MSSPTGPPPPLGPSAGAPPPGPPRPPSSGRTAALVVGGALAALVLLAGLVVAVAGGGDETPSSERPAATSTTGAAATAPTSPGRRYPADPRAVDVCSLLSREELRAVARADLGEPRREDPAPGEPNPVKRCRYESEDRIEVTVSRYFFLDTTSEFETFYTPGRPDDRGEPTRYPVEPIDGLPTGSARDPQDFLNLDVAVLTPGGWTLDVHVARHDLPPNGALVGELRRLTALALDRYAPR